MPQDQYQDDDSDAVEAMETACALTSEKPLPMVKRTGTESTAGIFSDDTRSPATSRTSLDTSISKQSSADQLDDRVDWSENLLLALWSTLLNLPEHSIGGQRSFFELGGDSILAMKLVGDARARGLALTVAAVFQHPTFDDMVASVRAAHTNASSTDVTTDDEAFVKQDGRRNSYERFSLLAASNIDSFLQHNVIPQVGVFKGGLSDVLPATDFQSLAVTGALLESRWMLNYLYLDGSGTVIIVRLMRVCSRLVQALDILRTVFVPSGNRFLQVVLRTLRPTFRVVEVDDESLDDFTARLQRGERGPGDGSEDDGDASNSPRPGDPFVEFTVVKQRHSPKHRILMRISHAQYDGVCLPRMLEAFQAAYQADTIPQPVSFANYLRASAGARTSGHYQHWKKLLEGSSMTELVRRQGPSYNRPAGGQTVCLKRSVYLPAVKSGDITTATVVKAAWAYVLAQVSASGDVVFGHTISGRNAAVEGVENMVGPCVNLVPVRVVFGGPYWTALDLLRYVQGQQVANMPHEVLGFREIIRHCTSWADWTYFTSTVQHQNIDQSAEVRLGDVDYRKRWAAAAQEDFADLSVFSQHASEGGMDDMYEVMLSFPEGGAIPRDFAARALDLLCDAARLFAIEPGASLPSPAELSRRPQLVPFEETSSTAPAPSSQDALGASSRLQHVDRPQLVGIAEIVSTAWRQVLSLPNQQGTAEYTESQPGTAGDLSMFGGLDPDTSFFDRGGDIIGIAQLAWMFGQRGFSVPRLEDLINHPTVLGHVAVLASDPGASDIRAGNAATANAAESDSERVGNIGHGEGKSKKTKMPFAKAARLFRRITRRKAVAGSA